jgi:hypothetical protein
MLIKTSFLENVKVWLDQYLSQYKIDSCLRVLKEFQFLQLDQDVLAIVRNILKNLFKKIDGHEIDFTTKIVEGFTIGRKSLLEDNELIDIAMKLFFNNIDSHQYDRANKIRSAFLRDVNFLENLPKGWSREDFCLQFGEKSDWQQLLGGERMKKFIETIKRRTDKTQDVARNAFTHTEFDRASKFFQFLHKNNLFEITGEEFDVATEYINTYSMAANKMLYAYFRALKFLDLQSGESPMVKLEILLVEGKTLPPGIDRNLCLELAENEVQSLDILEEKYKKLAARIYSGEKVTADYLKNISNFERVLLRAVIGYDTHGFLQGRQSFGQIINDFIGYQNGSYYKEFPIEAEKEKNYQPMDFRSTKIEYEFDPTELENPQCDYQVLRKEFLSIFNQDLSRREIFEDISDAVLFKLRTIIDGKKQDLSESKDKSYEKKKIDELEESIKRLQLLGVEFVDAIKLAKQTEQTERDEQTEPDEQDKRAEQAFKLYGSLLKFVLSLDKKVIKEMESELRKLIFQKTVKGSAREGFVDLAKNLKSEDVSAEAVFGLVNLLSEPIGAHVLNKENMDKAWDEETWKAILAAKENKRYNLFSLFGKQLGDLSRVANNMKMLTSDEGGFNIKCYPTTDDFLGEVSGYLGNACYTKVYPLLEQYPSNLIPFKFVSERDKDNRELFGSVLVFELQDNEGNDVALLRAFNVPRESEIDVGKFIENFIEKISPTLKARGIKKILVPGMDGAISNYGLIRKHMHRKYIDGKNPLSLSDKFDFNGYNITKDCYLVRVL